MPAAARVLGDGYRLELSSASPARRRRASTAISFSTVNLSSTPANTVGPPTAPPTDSEPAPAGGGPHGRRASRFKIGRASGRERVEISGVAVSLKKKKR